MGDGRVTEQALNVGLAQRHQVTEDDRGEGDQAQHHAYRFAVAHRHVYRNRRITTPKIAILLAVARKVETGAGAPGKRPSPRVERHQRQFKAKTDDHQTKTRQQQRLVQHVVRQGFCPARGRTGCRSSAYTSAIPNSRKDEAAAGEEQSVFDARFQRTLLAEGVTNQAEQRQRNQLNTEEQRRQMIRTGQQNAARAAISTSR